MPARLIRDGILESEAVLSLPVEARWVYVSILLTADDLGLFEATPFRIARKADIRRELADTMVQMLVDRDLIRLYEEDGRQYGFIPRYAQRVQIRKAKYPLPPMALLHGDQDAIKKINDLGRNPTVDHGDPTVGHGKKPPEAEAEAEVNTPSSLRSEGEGADAPPPPKPKVSRPKPPAFPCPADVDPQVWTDWLELRRKKSAPVTPTVINSAMQESVKADIPLEEFLRIWCLRGSQGLFAEWLKPNEIKAAKAKARSSHSGFDKIDYTQGVTDDGFLI